LILQSRLRRAADGNVGAVPSVGAAGGDEVGDVAAFCNVHVVTERLIGEIRAMTAAIRQNRLDHRADVGVVGVGGDLV
jgi:hypothetical protein